MSFRTFTKFKKRPTAPVARRGRRSAVTDALEDDIMQFRESLGVELARLQQSQALLDSEDEQPTQPRMRAGASTPCSRRTSYTRSSNLNTSNGNLATHLVVPDIRLSPPSEGDMARSVSTTCLMDSGVFDSDTMRFTVQRYDTVPTNPSPAQRPDGDVMEPSVPIRHRLFTYESPYCSTVDSNGHCYSSETPDGKDPVARRGRLFAKRQQRRLVHKDGTCNVIYSHVKHRKRKFAWDIFTTILEWKWRYHFGIFVLSYLLTWFFFALLWYCIVLWHGDHHFALDDENHEFCVVNVNSFITALLFSIETQHTIGYGSRSMHTKCGDAVVLLMMQSAVGVFIQSLMVGVMFAKLSKPKRRGGTILFSKNAVICTRDGSVCMLFRVADMRKSHLVSNILRVHMVKSKTTKEGEHIPSYQYPLEVKTESNDDFLSLVWPTTISHEINELSPLYEMSAEQLLKERFEIIVYLEGTIESTGYTMQVRTSYLPSEILWGHRLAPLVHYQRENGQYLVDYTRFHDSFPYPMHECSARDFLESDDQLSQSSFQMRSAVAAATMQLPSSQTTTNVSFDLRHHTISPHDVSSAAEMDCAPGPGGDVVHGAAGGDHVDDAEQHEKHIYETELSQDSGYKGDDVTSGGRGSQSNNTLRVQEALRTQTNTNL